MFGKNKKIFTFNNVLIGMAIIIFILSFVLIALLSLKKTDVVKTKSSTDTMLKNYVSTEEADTNKWDVSENSDGSIIATLSEDGIFTVSGIGNMRDYSETEFCPWYEVSTKIKEVKVEKGVLCIGNYAFSRCTNLKTVEISSTVTRIGYAAFQGCIRLENVEIPSNVIIIGGYAFSECVSLVDFEIPTNVKVVGDYVLYESKISKWVTKENNVIEIPKMLQRTQYENDVLYAHSDWGISIRGCESLTKEKILEGGFFSIDDNCQEVVIRITGGVLYDFTYRFCFNTWDLSWDGDGSVIAKLSEDGILNISGTGEIDSWPWDWNDTWTGVSEKIKAINIEEGIEKLSWDMFMNCINLTYVKLPNTLKEINNGVFQYCSSLVSIDIPSSVTYISSDAFDYCDKLKEINVDDNNEEYCDVEGILYSKDKTRLIRYPANKQNENYEILSEVKTIENRAFLKCENLISVTIPSKVTRMDVCAFSECSNLTEVKIEEGVTVIGEWAFSECSSLTNITLPNSITSIGKNAFKECSNLTNINFPDNITSIGEYAFEGCSNLTNVIFPDSVTSLGDYAFAGCINLTNIELSNSLTTVGTKIFWECINLTNIEIPSSMTIIPDEMFMYCANLQSVNIPVGIDSIGNWAFYGCNNLKEVNIPNTVTNIGTRAFWECYNLTDIVLPVSLTTIGEGAFSNCSNLANIELPNTITNIPNYMFYYCTSLQSIVIPDGVTSIGESAFSGCTNLKEVNIPNSVTNIGSQAFSECNNLSNILPTNLESVGESAFYSVNVILVDKETEQIELPDILKRTQDSNDILFSNEELSLDGCSIVDSNIIIEKEYENINATITVNSGVLKGFSICILSNSWTQSNNEIEYSIEGNILNISSTGELNYFDYGYYYDYIRNSIEIINIKEGITSVDLYDLYSNNIKSIKIPSTVTNINIEEGYYGIEKIAEIDVNDNNQYYCDIDGVLYTKDKTKIVKYPTGKIETEYTIPEGVLSIGKYAFSGCINLESINIPESLTDIEIGAFYGCGNLLEINVNENNKFYVDYEGVVYTKDHTKIVKYPQKKEDKEYEILYGVLSIEPYAFEMNIFNYNYYYDYTYTECYNKALESVKIPNTVKSIGEKAFYLANLTAINIPDGVNAIGEYAFCGNSLKGMKVSNSIINMKNRAYDIYSMEYIYIPRSVVYMDNSSINDQTTIICTKGSTAEQFAIENNIDYVLVNEITPDNLSGGLVINQYYNIIIGIKLEMTLDEITNYINLPNISYEIIDNNGNVVEADDVFIGTGYGVKLEDGSIYTIVIKGDINGDGKMKLSDLSKLKLALMGTEELDAVYENAADINNDGKVKLSDLSKLKLDLLETSN